MQVQCNSYDKHNWMCCDCWHGAPHDAVSIRNGMREDLPCDEFADMCFMRQIMVICEPVTEDY